MVHVLPVMSTELSVRKDGEIRRMCWQIFLPESPRWLLLAGRREQAKKSLAWARGKYGKDAVMLDAEYNDMVMMSSGLDEVRGESSSADGAEIGATTFARKPRRSRACYITQAVGTKTAVSATERDTNAVFVILDCRLILHNAETLHAPVVHRPVPHLLPADHRTAICPLLCW